MVIKDKIHFTVCDAICFNGDGWHENKLSTKNKDVVLTILVVFFHSKREVGERREDNEREKGNDNEKGGNREWERERDRKRDRGSKREIEK